MSYRAILVDPVARAITALEIANDHRAIQAVISADCLASATIERSRDGAPSVMAVVDDSGLIKGLPCFRFSGYRNPLAGRAVLIGCDYAGETVSCPLDIEIAKSRVSWVESAHAVAQARANVAIDAAKHRAAGLTVETSEDGLVNIITAGRS